MFESDYYKERRKDLIEDIQEKQKEIITAFEEKINKEGFTMIRIQVGPIIKPELVPTIDGNAMNFAQLTQLMEHHDEDVEVGGVHDMLSRAILVNGKAAERKDYT